MPSSAQRRGLAAALAVTAVLIVLLGLQQYITKGPALPMQRSDSAAKASNSTDRSPPSGRPAASNLYAFCNITGPCEFCAPSQKRHEMADADACPETGYRQRLQCLVAKDDGETTPEHEVRKWLSQGSDDITDIDDDPPRAAGDVFSALYPCSEAASSDLSLAAFEWLMAALLTISLPVIIVRKQGGLEGLRLLLPK